MEKILDVKNLRISFKTNNGTVKAVRDISLELGRGETLAIVGESGSGKSVTAKAMLGILAPNSIIENGEIIYDGKDLLKLSEEEFHDYRGNRISMIFQDPMSSLNPIMRIGKQLTEAMILNGKANQRAAKKELAEKTRLLKKAMLGAASEGEGITPEQVNSLIAQFREISAKAIRLSKEFGSAHQAAVECRDELALYIADIKKDDPKNIAGEMKGTAGKLLNVFSPYVITKDNSVYKTRSEEFRKLAVTYKKKEQADRLIEVMKALKNELEQGISKEKPDFFAMGCYLIKQPGAEVYEDNIKALNEKMQKCLEESFLKEFAQAVAKGLEYSARESLKAKKTALEALKKGLPVYEKETLDRGECERTAVSLIRLVDQSIDRLALKKENLPYVFGTSLNSAIKKYFEGIPRNRREEKRFAKDQAKYEKAAAKGRDIGKPVPALLVDLDLEHSNMIHIVQELCKLYEGQIRQTVQTDYDELAREMLRHLYLQETKVVHKVTKGMAKHHAIELMEEVGIAEARKRYQQFPFEFSGGMRQRIVIAIALAANPDILICDEPTTALDVTIQSQILELINKLKEERKLSIIFITHDLGVVANMADRIAVMYAGKIVEYGTADEIFYEPAHPYTWALLSSMPDLDTKEKLEAIPGTPPNMIHPPKGDAFAARNKYAMEIDFEEQPPMFEITPTHHAATWLLHPNAPKVEPPKIVTDRIERMRKLEVGANE